MQRERSSLDSFPETIDLNQGSFPNNNNAMDHSTPWDNMLNPAAENRLSNYMLASSVDRNVDANNQRFNGWDHGESSSGANIPKNRPCSDDDSDMRLEWSSSFSACSGADARTEGWSFEPCNINGTRPPALHNYTSTRSSQGHIRENDFHRVLGTEPMRTFYPSSSNVGSSSNTFMENNDGSGPSFGSWGSSCKRKALEGTSRHFYPPGGSSSSNQPAENIVSHSVPGCYTSPENLSGMLNLSPANHLEQLNPRSSVAPIFFPSSTVNPGIAENSSRNFVIRSSLGHHESVPFDTSRMTSARHSSVYAAPQLSRPISNIDSLELRSPMNNPNALNQPHFMHVNEARGMHPSHPWNNGSFSSRGGGSSSSSFMLSGERGGSSGVREEGTLRVSRRNNNMEYPTMISAPETRNVLQNQIDWSFAPGNSRNNQASASQVGHGASGRASSSSTAAWLPHQHQSHQRLSETAPWIPFPRIESDSETRRSHLAFLPSGSSSPEEAATSSRAYLPSDQRSAAFLMDMPRDDVHGWRALAAVEGRHRLIRQVLSAMRRGVHLQAEDYVLIDPFINGFAELHDRHRDMRLDVDNMSYEELLALEEQIGNVNTGLSEEKIWASMKQRKYETMESKTKTEPCCICQENYIARDAIGILDCGHEFHTNCIKQWLTLKNLCPICKLTALN